MGLRARVNLKVFESVIARPPHTRSDIRDGQWAECNDIAREREATPAAPPAARL